MNIIKFIKSLVNIPESKSKSGHIEPTKEWPKVVAPELPISCIAQHILDDLDIKNIDKWKLNGGMFNYYLDNDKYQIYVGAFSYERFGEPVYYTGLRNISYNLNSRENKLFISAATLIYNSLLDAQYKEYKLKNQEKLKELFPDCFVNK